MVMLQRDVSPLCPLPVYDVLSAFRLIGTPRILLSNGSSRVRVRF